MQKFWLFLITLLLAGSLEAQDPHFTQFYSAPLTLNPALTGTFDGRYRFSAIYRDQWRRVLDNPYQTFAGALDFRFPVEWQSTRSNDAAAVGLLFFTDKVDVVDFVTTEIAVSGAYHKSLSSQDNSFLTLGVQIGLAQRSVNYENLTFNDQFDGTQGYTFGTGETLPANNLAFADYAVGLNYSYSVPRGIAIFVGGSLHHIFEPQTSFYFDKERDDPTQFGDAQLFRRYSAQLSARLPLGDRLQLLPRAILNAQGPHLEINAGSNLRMQLGEFSPAAVHIGSWVRPVGQESGGFDLDALVLMTGFELNNVLLGFSYDITLNDLSATRQGQGAFEISIAYLGNYENETILCPKF